MSHKSPKPDPRYSTPRVYYLYVKIHKKTGLKYLGRTAQKSPSTYLGSGVYWLRHLKKHGNEHDTIVLGKYAGLPALKEAGLHYSKLWNVVKSKRWANLCEEDGNNETKGWRWLTTEMRSANGKKGGAKGGAIMGPRSYQLGIGVHGLSKEQRIANSRKGGLASALVTANMPELKIAARERMLNNNPFKGKKHNESTKAAMRAKKANSVWITDGSSNRIVRRTDIDSWLKKGFQIGRSILWQVPKRYKKRG